MHRISHYPLDSAIGFAMTYPLVSDLKKLDKLLRILTGNCFVQKNCKVNTGQLA